ncbi:HAD family hydrolase [bacterium]|nr:HAD family hydrolase [candidate division CSSED10-310 bacterium]
MTVVLFDIDGTIVTKVTSGVTGKQVAYTRVIEEIYGIANLDYMMFPIFGLTDQGILYLMLRAQGIDDAVIASGQAEFARRVVACNDAFARGCETQYGALPGAYDLLRLLKREAVTLALATGNYESLARFKLAEAGLEAFFSGGGFGEAGIAREEIVREAVRRTRSSAVEPVVLLGDTPNDINAAHQNGIACIAVATGRFSRQELIACAYSEDDVFPDLTDTQAVMNRIHTLCCTE